MALKIVVMTREQGTGNREQGTGDRCYATGTGDRGQGRGDRGEVTGEREEIIKKIGDRIRIFNFYCLLPLLLLCILILQILSLICH